MKKRRNASISNLRTDVRECSIRKKNTHKCFKLFKFENDIGIGPDMRVSSICILFKFEREPSSSGKGPDSWFPVKALKTRNITLKYQVFRTLPNIQVLSLALFRNQNLENA
jgi:hypothetical protein